MWGYCTAHKIIFATKLQKKSEKNKKDMKINAKMREKCENFNEKRDLAPQN